MTVHTITGFHLLCEFRGTHKHFYQPSHLSFSPRPQTPCPAPGHGIQHEGSKNELYSSLETHLKIFTPKSPIAKHLKESMMREISAHVLQVIVAPSGPHTFLAISNTSEGCHLTSWIHCAQEDGLELEAQTNGRVL